MVSSPRSLVFFEKLTQFVMIHEVDCRSFPLSGTTLLYQVAARAKQVPKQAGVLATDPKLS
jgi:late competence protein required for DNA uptake (superfamily II DNA/RNA helicase)